MPRIRRRPKSDWTCREVLDATVVEPRGHSECEFCGHRLRWIHVLEHDEYHRSVHAGCCCAMRLCFEYDAEGAEQEAKNRAGRLMRFVDRRRWRTSRRNPENIVRSVKLPDKRQVNITVFLKEGRYMIFLDFPKSGEKECHWAHCATQEEAMALAFERVEKLKNEIETDE